MITEINASTELYSTMQDSLVSPEVFLPHNKAVLKVII